MAQCNNFCELLSEPWWLYAHIGFVFQDWRQLHYFDFLLVIQSHVYCVMTFVLKMSSYNTKCFEKCFEKWSEKKGKTNWVHSWQFIALKNMEHTILAKWIDKINEPTELCCKESWEKVMNLSIFLTPPWIARDSLAETAHCPALFNQFLGDFWQLNVCQGREVTFHPNGTLNSITETLRMRPISSPLENLPVDAGLDKDCLLSKFSMFAPSTHPFDIILLWQFSCKGEPICVTLLRK